MTTESTIRLFITAIETTPRAHVNTSINLIKVHTIITIQYLLYQSSIEYKITEQSCLEKNTSNNPPNWETLTGKIIISTFMHPRFGVENQMMIICNTRIHSNSHNTC
jgi:hypothetical protein